VRVIIVIPTQFGQNRVAAVIKAWQRRYVFPSSKIATIVTLLAEHFSPPNLPHIATVRISTALAVPVLTSRYFCSFPLALCILCASVQSTARSWARRTPLEHSSVPSRLSARCWRFIFLSSFTNSLLLSSFGRFLTLPMESVVFSESPLAAYLEGTLICWSLQSRFMTYIRQLI
jgi:hypothetical protein